MRTAERTHRRTRRISAGTPAHPLAWATLVVASAFWQTAGAQPAPPAPNPEAPPVAVDASAQEAPRAWTWADGCVAGHQSDACAQDFQEGLAAIKLERLDDERGRWGFVNPAGEVVIAPRYDDIEPFQNGLAPVSLAGIWGYIDRRGTMAIEPRFAYATGFNAEGTAIAVLDDHDVLIDRRGKVLKTFPLGTRTYGFQPGQRLAAMKGPDTAVLFDMRTGRSRPVPDDIMELGDPQDGQVPALRRSSRYGGEWGMLDAQGKWAAAPDALRSQAAPVRIGHAYAVLRDHVWRLVDASGKEIDAARFAGVRAAAPGFWLLTLPDNRGFEVRDAAFKVVLRDASRYPEASRQDGGWHLVRGDARALLIPPEGEPVELDASGLSVEYRRGMAWVRHDPARAARDAELAPPMVPPPMVPPPMVPSPPAVPAPPPRGASADAAASAAQAAPEEAEAADSVEADSTAADAAIPAPPVADRAGPTDMADAAAAVAAAADAAAADAAGANADDPDETLDIGDEPRLRQIYTARGDALLRPDVVKALAQYRVWAYGNPGEPDLDNHGQRLPLAHLSGRDSSAAPALLTLSGKIVSRSEWQDIQGNERHAPARVLDHDRKIGTVDAEGEWLVPPRFERLEAYAGPYTWAWRNRYEAREPELIDFHGKVRPLPPRIAAQGDRLRGDVLRYRLEEGRNSAWGLWSIARNAPVNSERYQDINEFSDDWAVARQGDLWGVIDLKGKWVIPATHTSPYGFYYQQDGVMRVRDDDDRYQLVDLRTGRATESFEQEPRKLGPGRYLGRRDDASPVLIAPIGTSVQIARNEPTNQKVLGDWLHLRFEGGNGALDARGNWRVKPELGDFNPFFVQPEGLARVYHAGQYTVMDQQGRKVLAQLGDGTPLASMQRIAFRDDRAGEVRITDLQGREITRVQGTYSLHESSASEGLVPYRAENGRWGLINAAGRRVVGPHFTQIGPMKQGRAPAAREERTGAWLGYIAPDGSYAIPPRYIEANPFSEGRARVRLAGTIQYIDTAGQPQFQLRALCGVPVLLDSAGRITWPATPLTCKDAEGLPRAEPVSSPAAKNP